MGLNVKPPQGGDIAFAAVGAAIQGRREEQQDAFRLRRLSADDDWLLVVADGMGGEAAGSLASKIAVDGLVASYVKQIGDCGDPAAALRAALTDVNDRIAAAQRDAPAASGMGTTLLATHVSPAGLLWLSVGDSPLWLFRSGELKRLNDDHSLREFVDSSGGNANLLRSAVTGEQIALVDAPAERLQLLPGDLLLLASDGLLTLDEGQIASTLTESGGADLEEIARRLLDHVERVGDPSQDNCTVLLLAARSAPTKAAQSRWGLIGYSALAAVTLVLVAYVFLVAE